jgi:imidazolonepropionase-like amidohydrolase
MVRKEKEIFPLIEEGFRNAVKAGVKVVLGSDSGMPYTPFGKSSMEELELMVKMGGMSEMDAIVAGTGNAAKAIGIGSKVGTIQPGMSADILVLGSEKDPLKDITILQDPESIELVMFKGTIHQRATK